ncbi:MAG TPA: four helix bundle protein [Gemmatimonadaceae bacterium]|nr:four helix bundle protein [Gemmatimonadaceae bacterium]
MPSSVRELRVWQEAVATAGELARVARKASRPETRTLVDLLVRCSSEVALGVARAHVKDTPTAQRDAFRLARDAAAALETGLAIARHAELFPLATCADLAVKAGNVSRLIAGYLAYLDRLIEADAEAARFTAPLPAATPAQ